MSTFTDLPPITELVRSMGHPFDQVGNGGLIADTALAYECQGEEHQRAERRSTAANRRQFIAAQGWAS